MKSQQKLVVSFLTSLFVLEERMRLAGALCTDCSAAHDGVSLEVVDCCGAAVSPAGNECLRGERRGDCGALLAGGGDRSCEVERSERATSCEVFAVVVTTLVVGVTGRADVFILLLCASTADAEVRASEDELCSCPAGELVALTPCEF